MTRRQVAVLIVGVILLVVAATTGLALRTTSTSPLVWTVALDGFPQSIVVDAQTRRAFVTTIPIPFGVGGTSMNVLDTGTGAILSVHGAGQRNHDRHDAVARRWLV